MIAKITKVEFLEEKEGQYGPQFNFKIHYGKKSAYYTSKKRDQKHFVEGKETEFNEEARTSQKGGEYLVVKPIYAGGNRSNYGKNLHREQARYSGFAVSYVKDLIIADKLKIEDWEKASKKIFNFMVGLDKGIQQ